MCRSWGVSISSNGSQGEIGRAKCTARLQAVDQVEPGQIDWINLYEQYSKVNKWYGSTHETGEHEESTRCGGPHHNNMAAVTHVSSDHSILMCSQNRTRKGSFTRARSSALSSSKLAPDNVKYQYYGPCTYPSSLLLSIASSSRRSSWQSSESTSTCAKDQSTARLQRSRR